MSILHSQYSNRRYYLRSIKRGRTVVANKVEPSAFNSNEKEKERRKKGTGPPSLGQAVEMGLSTDWLLS